MEQLGTVDALFAYSETPNTPMHIGQLLIYDPSTAAGGNVRFKEILSYLDSRLDGSRLFRRKLVRVPLDLDHPYWVEDSSFDLEYHVRHIALPKPGNWRQLCIQVARIYARPLDMSRPLWEFTVIEGLDRVAGVPEGSFAILQKYHHAAVDGKAGVEMSHALHDADARQKPRSFDMQWTPESEPGSLDLLARAHFNNIVNPIRGLRNLRKLVPVPKQLLGVRRQYQRQEQAQGGVPRSHFNTKLGPHRVFEGAEFALSNIKKVRAAFPGATVNDVMIAIVSGAMREYLMTRDLLPAETLKFGVPVSIRTETGEENTGNEVAIMTVGAGTHLSRADDRLQFVVSETRRSKAITKAMDPKALMDLSGAMPAGLTASATKMMLRSGMVNRVSPAFNTAVTNVPGPMEAMYFAGAKLVKSWGTGVLAEGQGIFHVVTSYHGSVFLTFLADRDLMPDPEAYSEMLSSSFALLMQCVAHDKPRPRRAKSRK
ncbi:MAG: wax ester/triacylglycerol synthase family O-acyltransferase [Pseudomonadota bacterium]